GPHGVLRFEISVGGLGHDLRWGQTDTSPLKAAVDHPLKDAGPFRLKLLLSEVWVALLNRNGDREGDEIEPALYCFINGTQGRLVVAGDQQLELWCILEEVLAHEPR